MSWGAARKAKLTITRTKQKQCIRGKFFAHRGGGDAEVYYILLEILDLNDIFNIKLPLFAHKIQNDKKIISAVFSGAPANTSVRNPSPQHEVCIKSKLL